MFGKHIGLDGLDFSLFESLGSNVQPSPSEYFDLKWVKQRN